MRVVDLGCGNAYLTFAAHAWLRDRYPIHTTGVDVKEQSRLHNTEVAARLGFDDEMTFLAAGISDVRLDESPDVEGDKVRAVISGRPRKGFGWLAVLSVPVIAQAMGDRLLYFLPDAHIHRR